MKKTLVAAALVAIIALASDARTRALPLGIHTLRVDDGDLQQVRGLGAGYVLQVFPWREIEPSPGEYHWEYTDWLLRAAEYYKLRVVARLDKTPHWAGAPDAFNAIPYRIEDYLNFASSVAARYRGRIAAYIIWNEPNISREWGDQSPNPGAYAAMLVNASARIRQSDPTARIVAAGLAPTNENSPRAMDDRAYLRALYASGIKDTFDILAAHPYANANPPDDPRDSHNSLNFYRLFDLSDIMAANGDAAKPIWITEFGYTTDPPIEFAHLRVSEADQASWIPQAYQIAQQEMPFVEMFGVWNLNHELPLSDEQASYSLIHTDRSPKPAYAAVAAIKKESLAASALGNIASKLMPSPTQLEHQILARDAIVHLGDSEYPTPWVPLYKTKNPSIEWKGEFYLTTADLDRRWRLTLETMQVNDLDNRLFVNGQPIVPPTLAPEDFTSIWVTSRFDITAIQLAAGRNTVTIRVGKLFAAFQQFGFTWDDIQIRNVALRAVR
jgi:hypothetical protein